MGFQIIREDDFTISLAPEAREDGTLDWDAVEELRKSDGLYHVGTDISGDGPVAIFRKYHLDEIPAEAGDFICTECSAGEHSGAYFLYIGPKDTGHVLCEDCAQNLDAVLTWIED